MWSNPRVAGITVAIPAHPSRARSGMLGRATGSVHRQTLQPAALSVAMDLERQGAPATRQRALEAVSTPWVAFLDSDDQFGSEHLEALAGHAAKTEADYVYSWYVIPGAPIKGTQRWDPLPHFGKPFDPTRPTQTTITVLVRTDLARAVGFREPPEGAMIDGQRYGEDFQFTVECVKAGARIEHLPQRTWFWHHHDGNTSGRPDRGDAKTCGSGGVARTGQPRPASH